MVKHLVCGSKQVIFGPVPNDFQTLVHIFLLFFKLEYDWKIAITQAWVKPMPSMRLKEIIQIYFVSTSTALQKWYIDTRVIKAIQCS